MKHTINTLAAEVERLKSQDERIASLESEIDQIKDAIDQFLLTTNSAYKKRKAVDSVGDFLEKRFGRARAS